MYYRHVRRTLEEQAETAIDLLAMQRCNVTCDLFSRAEIISRLTTRDIAAGARQFYV